MHKEYFIEIFSSSKTVIIPGLGSFTKADNGKITFNPYLKFNDGHLVGFIAKKQGISADDAGKMVLDNVEKINEALEKKNEALVLGLGVLRKNKDGKVEFITDVDVKGSDPVIEAPKVEKPVVKALEIPTVEVPKVEAPKVEIPKVVPPKVETPKVEIPKVEVPKVEAPKVEVKGVTAPPLTQTAVDGKSKAKEKKPVAPKPPKDKSKKKFPLVLVIIIVVLGGAGGFTAWKWEMVKGWIGMGDEKVAEVKTESKEQNSKSENEAIAPVDSVVIDTTAATAATTELPVEEVKTEPVETPKTDPIPVNPPPVTVTGTFHVICGNFTDPGNASNMVSKLTAEGNQALNLGLRGSYYMVSAGSFSTQQEAQSKLEAIKSAHPKAYIYNGN